MRKITKTSVFAFVLFASMLAFGSTAQAGMGEFSVSPVFPENQNPETSNYFDLRVIAGQTEVVYITVSNLGEREIFVDVSLITATTSRDGDIDYASARGFIEGNTNAFTNIARVQEGDIFISAGEQIDVPITINIPAEGFDGIILGAIEVLLGITDEEREAAGMLVNRFAHRITILLRENDTIIPVDFELGGVSAGLYNSMATITAEIVHPQPRLTMGTQINARVYQEGNDTPLFDFQNIHADFAPNSIFYFPFVDFAGHGVAPGDYHVMFQIIHNDKTWEFDRAFTIEGAQAAAINDSAVNLVQTGPNSVESSGSQSGFPVWAVIVIAASAAITAVAAVIIFNIISQKKLKKVQSEKSLKSFQEYWDE